MPDEDPQNTVTARVGSLFWADMAIETLKGEDIETGSFEDGERVPFIPRDLPMARLHHAMKAIELPSPE